MSSIAAARPFTWLWVMAIVLADVGDGMLARRCHRDTRSRRVADALLDRASVHGAFAVAMFQHPSLLWLYVPLAVRDVLALSASGWLIASRGLLLLGGRWHKLASLSCAAFGIAVVGRDERLAVAAGLVALAVNYMLLLDYVGGYAFYRRGGCVSQSGRYRIGGLAGLRFLLTPSPPDRAPASRRSRPASA